MIKDDRIKKALIDIANDWGIVEFAKGLISFEVKILSTRKTANLLRKNRVPVVEVSDYINFP